MFNDCPNIGYFSPKVYFNSSFLLFVMPLIYKSYVSKIKSDPFLKDSIFKWAVALINFNLKSISAFQCKCLTTTSNGLENEC